MRVSPVGAVAVCVTSLILRVNSPLRALKCLLRLSLQKIEGPLLGNGLLGARTLFALGVVLRVIFARESCWAAIIMILHPIITVCINAT